MANINKNIERLQAIQNLLPRGEQTIIAKAAGVSRTTVNLVLSGKKPNSKLIPFIFQYFLEWHEKNPVKPQKEVDKVIAEYQSSDKG